MPRPASRFIKKLTKRQIQQLEANKDRGATPRIRHRAHAILLSHQGTSVVELVQISKPTERRLANGWTAGRRKVSMVWLTSRVPVLRRS
jgi:site-specific recombinase XerD